MSSSQTPAGRRAPHSATTTPKNKTRFQRNNSNFSASVPHEFNTPPPPQSSAYLYSTPYGAVTASTRRLSSAGCGGNRYYASASTPVGERRGSVGAALPPPTASRMVRLATVPVRDAWKASTPLSTPRGRGGAGERTPGGSAYGRTRTAAPPVEKRKKYVVGTMSHCGLIYEELTRQLLASGRWTQLSVRQRSVAKTLYIGETQRDLSDTNMHLLLGQKIPCERVIATRRSLAARYGVRVGEAPRKSDYGYRVTTGIRMPMGTGDDGQPRLVDFVENTRCITLKSTMVSTLLKHHHHDWTSLGRYLPMCFKIYPRQVKLDERLDLLDTCKNTVKGRVGGSDRLWIAKSSSGCHGDNIEIFSGDRQGLMKLLRFVDRQRNSQPWVAQQYIDRPLLYHKRKFDIRCWVLFLRDTYEIFVHEELVMRMSSVAYDRETATSGSAAGRLAHITNHCVQEESKTYSLYEEGNELWREHLDGLIRYKGSALGDRIRRDKSTPVKGPHSREASTSSAALRDTPYHIAEVRRGDSGVASRLSSAGDTPSTATLNNTIMPQINFIVKDTILAAEPFIPEEPPRPATHTFQMYGYDFLIDEELKVWLLEINGAPGAAERLKPILMKDTIELAVAPYFPGTMPLKTKRHNGFVRVYPED